MLKRIEEIHKSIEDKDIVPKRLLLESNKDTINTFGITKIPQKQFEESIKDYL